MSLAKKYRTWWPWISSLAGASVPILLVGFPHHSHHSAQIGYLSRLLASSLFKGESYSPSCSRYLIYRFQHGEQSMRTRERMTNMGRTVLDCATQKSVSRWKSLKVY